jgi:hypothetical protein
MDDNVDEPAEDRTAAPPDELRTLGDRLKLLEGIVGHQLPARHFVQKEVAKMQGLDAPAWNRRLKGTSPVRELELAKLVDIYRLGPEIDFTIFFETSRRRFLARLKDARIGTYGGSTLTLLCNRIRRASLEPANKAYRVRLQTVRSRAIRGGVGRPREEPLHRYSVAMGDSVRVVCSGPPGRALVLLNAAVSGRVWLLSPTGYAPQAQSQAEPLTVPDDLSDPFTVDGPAEQYYLYALWTDSGTASLFQHVEQHQDELTDDAAATLLKRLEAIEEPLAAAFFNYGVER